MKNAGSQGLRAGVSYGLADGVKGASGPYFHLKIWISAGVRMTMNRAGMKKTIIGTVSFGGKDAAFFSAGGHALIAAFCASTRSALPERRAVALRSE